MAEPGYKVDFYDWLMAQVTSRDIASSVQIGLVWTMCCSDRAAGLAMTPQDYSRTLSFPGTLAGTPLKQLVKGIRSWEPFEASVAMAAVNAALPADPAFLADAIVLSNTRGNLAVFDYLLPRIKGARIVVIGRYPGMEAYESEYELQIIERNPGVNDFPDQATEYLLPEADWVFITASAITNKTFPRLAELSRNAMTVLMGPTTPWLPQLNQWGVDFLAGIVVKDEALLRKTVAEGGGRAIFEQAVSYVIGDIGKERMASVKSDISAYAERRDALKQEMAQWYAADINRRFPKLDELESLQTELSRLDKLYKQMWDIRHGRPFQQPFNGGTDDRETESI